MDESGTHIPQALQWAAQNFAVDRVTAEVTETLRERGIECIVLKGPAIAIWLYANDAPRLYADSDLLIRRADWDSATEALIAIGFRDSLGGLAHPRMESGEGYPWKRPADDADVDLHCTLFGLGADADVVWDTLRADARPLSVGGARVLAPSHPAILLHIALHAVQHGGEDELEPMRALDRRPMVDLECALARASSEEWTAAAGLAERLDAASTFGAGLSLLPEGRRLASRLGIDAATNAVARLRLEGVPMSEGFAELAQLPGVGPKLRLVLREAFPNREFMRWWKPLARRGAGGLALAYLWRLGWLGYRSVPGYLAWRRARNEAPRG